MADYIADQRCCGAYYVTCVIGAVPGMPSWCDITK